MKFRNIRIISLLLVLVMLCGMMPMLAFATEETEANPWSGRSAVFVGDSITAGSGTNNPDKPGFAEVIQVENKVVTVGRWRYSEPAQTSDENGQLVIFSKSSVAPAEIFE